MVKGPLLEGTVLAADDCDLRLIVDVHRLAVVVAVAVDAAGFAHKCFLGEGASCCPTFVAAPSAAVAAKVFARILIKCAVLAANNHNCLAGTTVNSFGIVVRVPVRGPRPL